MILHITHRVSRTPVERLVLFAQKGIKMFVDKNSLIINGVNFGPYVTQVDFGYNKLWSSDSGRNLAGAQVGTLIGIFPKLEVTFRKLHQADLKIIAPILDSTHQTVQYFDDNKQRMTTMETYTGDWKGTVKSIGTMEGVTCSFISTKRRN